MKAKLVFLTVSFKFLFIFLIISCDLSPESSGINMYGYNGSHKLIKVSVPEGGITFPISFNDDDTATVSKAFYIGETQVTYTMYFTVARWAQENRGYENLILVSPDYDYKNEIDTLHIIYPNYLSDVYPYGASPRFDKDYPVNGIQYTTAIVWCNAYTEWHNNKFKTNYTPAYENSNGEPVRKALKPFPPSGIGSITWWFDPVYNAYYDYLEEQKGVEKYFLNAPITGNGFRLPTANEWELAARWNGNKNLNSVNNTISGIDFSNQTIKFTKGNSASGAVDSIENTEETGKVAFFYQNTPQKNNWSQLQIPKLKKPNALGIYDMSGNLREIVYDVSYIDINRLDVWEKPTGEKVPWPFAQSRGGSYRDGDLEALAVGNFIYVDATAFNDFYGLRIARNFD